MTLLVQCTNQVCSLQSEVTVKILRWDTVRKPTWNPIECRLLYTAILHKDVSGARFA